MEKIDMYFKDSIVKNFLYTGLIQATNFLLPLITIPYLIRTVGIEKFGVINLALTLAVFLNVIVDYGFNITSVRDIAINKKEIQKISEIFNETYATKATLFFLCIVLTALLVFCVPFFTQYALIYMLSLTNVLGQALLPTWFFQGIEKMHIITYLNLISKIVFTLLVFTLIKEGADFLFVPFLYGLGNLFSGIIGIYIIVFKYKIGLKIISIKQIYNQIIQSRHVFLSNLSITIYMQSNVFILGIFNSDTIVGYYSVADKIIMAIRQLLSAFSISIYPKLCQVAMEGHDLLIAFLRKYFVPFLFFVSVISGLVFFLSSQIIWVFSGEKAQYSIDTLKILSIVPIIVAINIPFYQTLLAYNFQRSYQMLLTSGTIISLILNFILNYLHFEYGTPLAVLTTEIYITFGLISVLKFKHSSHSLF